MQTPYILPTSIIANAPGVNSWINPTNIFLVDNQYAVSTGSSNVMTVGNFNLNIPQGSDITNFTVQVKGYVGGFSTTLQIYAVDDTTGVTLSYPLAPFSGFSGTNTLVTLPSSLFGTTWTVNQANNIKFTLVANGELHLDAVLVSANYTPSVTPNTTVYYDNLSGVFQIGEILNDLTSGASSTIATNDGVTTLTLSGVTGTFTIGDSIEGATSHATATVSTPTGVTVIDEFVEAQPFNLASSMTDTDIFMYLQSFNYPDGITPIQYADFYGEADMVIDQGVPGSEEQVVITSVVQNYQGTGIVQIGFGSLNNRGLQFSYPYTTNTALRRPHFGTAQCVISNSARFYSRFLKRGQIGALVSAPITVDNQGSPLSTVATEFDFEGAGVVASNDGTNPSKKVITIPGAGVNPPNVSTTSTATSGASMVGNISWDHVSSGINRLLVVQATAVGGAHVSGVTYNGAPLIQGVAVANGTVDDEQWYLVAPPIGTYTIVVTLSASNYLTCGAETYNTVNQSSPIGVTQTSTGTSLTPSLVLTTGADNSLVCDSVSTGTLPIVYTPNSGQVPNWEITANPNGAQGASSVQSSGTEPDAVTMQWSITQSIPWAQTAMEIQGLSAPVTGVSRIIAGTNISISPSGGTGVVTVNSSGGGGGILLETNGVSNGSQSILNLVDGSNISITDDGFGNITISANGSGGGGLALAGQEVLLAGGDNIVTGALQLVNFSNQLIVKYSSDNSNVHYYTTDTNTDAFINGGTVIDTQSGMFVDTVNNVIYTFKAVDGGATTTYTLKKYDSSFSLVTTFTGTASSSGVHYDSLICFFVDGTHVVAQVSQTGSGADGYWTDFTISGTSLITPTVTNLQLYQTFGGNLINRSYAVYDGTNVYLQSSTNTGEPTNIVTQYTYSAAVFSSISTSTCPVTSSYTVNRHDGYPHGGFTIPSSGRIGWYRDTTVCDQLSGATNTECQSAAIYNVYTF